jgi:hypothetical protein
VGKGYTFSPPAISRSEKGGADHYTAQGEYGVKLAGQIALLREYSDQPATVLKPP